MFSQIHVVAKIVDREIIVTVRQISIYWESIVGKKEFLTVVQ